MKLDAFALSISGRRHSNEDAVCARPELGLFMVADGLGGYEGGEIASTIAVETIQDLVRRTASDADVTWPYSIDRTRSLDENEVIVATKVANDRIVARRSGVLDQMGSTVALLRFARAGRVVIAHVGDSRVYRLRDGAIQQLTADHSLVNQMIAAGMTPDETFPWRHVITRALGLASAEPDVQSETAITGDLYLLCSDGLYEGLEPAEMATLLDPITHGVSIEHCCRELVTAAYEGGSRDNISAVVVRAC